MSDRNKKNRQNLTMTHSCGTKSIAQKCYEEFVGFSMEREKGIQMHEAIIQQIQLFLNYKEAAQTSILSKSWFNAWATLPTLDLDEPDLQTPGGADSQPHGFSESSKNIMRRYEESNQKIESFRLCMKKTRTSSFSLAQELLARAVGLGARDLTLEFPSQTSGSISPHEELVRFCVSGCRIMEFVLPHEVLGSRELVRLSVSECRIDLGKVGFSMLKFLILRRVCMAGCSIWDITSSCPLIEELSLYECTSLSKAQSYTLGTVEISRMLALTEIGNGNRSYMGDTPGVTRMFAMTELGTQNNVVVRRITRYANLKCMSLEKIKINPLLFHDTSWSFPCLKELSLNECHGFIELQISSRSLEFLSISQEKVLTAKIDVPTLGKFTFTGLYIPSLSFQSSASTREWESDITLRYLQGYIRSSWLVRLKDFLMKLKLNSTKISLSLRFGEYSYGMLFRDGFEDIGDGRGLPKPAVENLMMSVNAPIADCSVLLKGVFWTCRPKFVAGNCLLDELSVGEEAKNEMVKLLCQTLIEEESEDIRYMYDLLEDVNVEAFDASVAEWQPLEWKAVLLDAKRSPEMKQNIRFKLSWGLDPSASL